MAPETPEVKEKPLQRPNRLQWEAMVAVSLVQVTIVLRNLPMQTLTKYQAISLLPVVYVACFAARNLAAAAICFAVLSQQLPVTLASGLVAVSLVLFSLYTRTAAPPLSSPTPVIQAIVALVVVMLCENFMIWVVSATYPDGYNGDDEALQDNGHYLVQLMFAGLSKQQVVSLRRLWNVQWSLVAALAATFGQTQLQGGDLYALATRAVTTLAAARFIRTASFLWTVLPSPVPNCYRRHFPLPPPPLFSAAWFWTGLQPAAHGGCNDLIVSGHATVTSTLACVVTSRMPVWLAGAVWMLLIMDYSVEIYEGFHYSVDMWMGLVLVTLLWRVFGKETVATGATPAAPSIQWVAPSVTEAIPHIVPAVLAYLQLVMLPKWMSNPMILVLISVAVGFFIRGRSKRPGNSDLHLAQHTAYCVLYLALGIYL